MAGNDEHAKFETETDNHPNDTGEYGCVWKHAKSIPKDKRKTHPCYYPWQGVLSIRANRARYQQNHRQAALAAGYLTESGGTWAVAAARAEDAVKAKADQRQQAATKSSPFDAAKRARFEARFRRFFTQPLELLARQADGWHVQHPHPDPHQFPGAVETFDIKDGRKWHPGQSYPYLHEHHHIIPMDALNRFVLSPPDEGHLRDDRIKVLLKAKWNLNHMDNMIVLPCEVVPARVVGMPAHCPWDEADHPKYTESLEAWLIDAKQSVDRAIKKKDHEVIVEAVQQLRKVSKALRQVIEQERGGERLAAVRPPNPGELQNA